MNALTIHQPLAWLISLDDVPMRQGFAKLSPKRIENRTWRPWGRAVGQPLAIHAGKKVDQDGVEHLRDLGVDVPETWVTMAVLAVANLTGSSRRPPEVGSGQAVWYVGPVAWILEDVKGLPLPIFVPGKRDIWPLEGQELERLSLMLETA